MNELLELVQLQSVEKYPSQLSGDSSSEWRLRGPLLTNPVLLFDEPFGALDTQCANIAPRDTLCSKINVPAIFITHDREALGGRSHCGAERGSPGTNRHSEEIYNHPATEHIATFLGAANVLPALFVTVGGDRCALP